MRYGSVCSGIGRPAIDLVGQRFGRLVVQSRAPNHKRIDRPTWECRCDCGKSVILPGGYLRSGRHKSCGCFRRDRAGQLYKKHGKSKTPEYCMFYDARKRALAVGLPFSIEPSDIVIPKLCPVLGIPLLTSGSRDNRPSLDRVIPSRGYVPDNIHVISFRANRIKSDASVNELRAVLAYCEANQ